MPSFIMIVKHCKADYHILTYFNEMFVAMFLLRFPNVISAMRKSCKINKQKKN